MTSSLLKALLVPGLLSCAVSGLPAAVHAEMPGMGSGPMAPHFPGARRGPEFDAGGLELAQRLAGAEIYIGIKPEQLGPWRAYTSALIALLEPGPMPLQPAVGDKPDAAPAVTDGGATPPAPPVFGERMADRILEQAEKARALKDASTALRQALSPEQAARLGVLSHIVMPPVGPGGSDPEGAGPRGRGPHMGPADRGGAPRCEVPRTNGPQREAPEDGDEPALRG